MDRRKEAEEGRCQSRGGLASQNTDDYRAGNGLDAERREKKRRSEAATGLERLLLGVTGLGKFSRNGNGCGSLAGGDGDEGAPGGCAAVIVAPARR